MDRNTMYDMMDELYPFIQELEPVQKQLFREQMAYDHYQPGKILVDEDELCDRMVFVVKGSVRVFRMSEDGREVTLYRIQQGDFCLMSAYCIMSDIEFPGLAQVETETDVVTLPAGQFQKLLHHNPELQSFILTSSLKRLKDVAAVLEDVTFASMPCRVARCLLARFREHGKTTLSMTHEQMAAEIGSAREVVSRTLKKLESQGLVRLKRGQVHLLQIESLENLCLGD